MPGRPCFMRLACSTRQPRPPRGRPRSRPERIPEQSSRLVSSTSGPLGERTASSVARSRHARCSTRALDRAYRRRADHLQFHRGSGPYSDATMRPGPPRRSHGLTRLPTAYVAPRSNSTVARAGRATVHARAHQARPRGTGEQRFVDVQVFQGQCDPADVRDRVERPTS